MLSSFPRQHTVSHTVPFTLQIASQSRLIIRFSNNILNYVLALGPHVPNRVPCVCIATGAQFNKWVKQFTCIWVQVTQSTNFDVSVRFWVSLYSSYHTITETRQLGSWALASAENSYPSNHIHTPMARVVSLQQIPTLRELYQRSVIAAHHGAVEEKFPFSNTLLDRVSV